MAKAVEFIQRSVQSRAPANTFIVLDTHSDAETGFLQCSGGQRNPKYVMASEVVENFGGVDLPAAMRTAAEQALGAEPPKEVDWYSDSAFSRGGWRGLLLATCSPAMQVDASFKDLRGLVEQWVAFSPALFSHHSLMDPQRQVRLRARVRWLIHAP